MSNIGNAMNRFGLRRGIKGSKRKYIPQQKLFQHCMDVQAEVDIVSAAQLSLLLYWPCVARRWRGVPAAQCANHRHTHRGIPPAMSALLK
jgi:hypothetical protein